MSDQQPSAAAIVEGVLYELMIDDLISKLLKDGAVKWVEGYLARHEGEGAAKAVEAERKRIVHELLNAESEWRDGKTFLRLGVVGKIVKAEP